MSEGRVDFNYESLDEELGGVARKSIDKEYIRTEIYSIVYICNYIKYTQPCLFSFLFILPEALLRNQVT